MSCLLLWGWPLRFSYGGQIAKHQIEVKKAVFCENTASTADEGVSLSAADNGNNDSAAAAAKTGEEEGATAAAAAGSEQDQGDKEDKVDCGETAAVCVEASEESQEAKNKGMLEQEKDSEDSKTKIGATTTTTTTTQAAGTAPGSSGFHNNSAANGQGQGQGPGAGVYTQQQQQQSVALVQQSLQGPVAAAPPLRLPQQPKLGYELQPGRVAGGFSAVQPKQQQQQQYQQPANFSSTSSSRVGSVQGPPHLPLAAPLSAAPAGPGTRGGGGPAQPASSLPLTSIGGAGTGCMDPSAPSLRSVPLTSPRTQLREATKDIVTAVTHHDINGVNAVNTVALKDIDVQMSALSGYETYV